MKKGSFFRTIILALATLVCCIVFADKTNANITINVNGGAAAVTNPSIPIETEDQGIEIPVVDEIPEGTINKGVFVDTVDLSGMDYQQAMTAVNQYVETLKTKEITLVSINQNTKVVTAGELGLKWANPQIISDAVKLGKAGNIVARYKELKDLEHSNKVYALEVRFDSEAIKAIVEAQGESDNIKPVDATIARNGDNFEIVPGQTGYVINVSSSTITIMSQLENNWNKEATTVELAVDVDEPKGKTDDLKLVKDLLGTYTTSFKTSGTARSGNVRNGTRLINGTVLYPGDEFSAYDAVNPFTEENGYYMAGSYLNGMVVESLGGGICQVTSTLYNAVLRAELDVTERSNHSMIVTYVDLSSDAAISGTSKNFRFVNNLDYPVYIEGLTSDDKKITFNVYGVETRPSNREISFESVEISKTEPEGEKIVADAALPIGTIDVQSAHTGYIGELWKVVKIDGVETERTKINKSTYTMTPRTATVGTATDDPNLAATIQTAIASGSIDYCKNVVASLKAAAAAATAGEPPVQDIPVE